MKTHMFTNGAEQGTEVYEPVDILINDNLL